MTKRSGVSGPGVARIPSALLKHQADWQHAACWHAPNAPHAPIAAAAATASAAPDGAKLASSRPPLTERQQKQLNVDFGGPLVRTLRFMVFKLILGPVLWVLLAAGELLKFVIGPGTYLRCKDRSALQLPDPILGLEHITVEANGIKFAGVRLGSGRNRPLALLLHGFPGTWSCWRNQLPALKGLGHEVVAVNMRGYHPTEVPEGVDSYRLDVLADDVAGLVKALGHQTATVVGHDWGGGVAWMSALRHPEVVSRLLVLCSPLPTNWLTNCNLNQALRSWYVLAFQEPFHLSEFTLRYNDGASINYMLHPYSPFSPKCHGAVNDDDVERIKLSLMHPGGATGMINYYRAYFDAMTTKPLTPGFNPRADRRLTVPTLLMWADSDMALGPQLTQGLGDIIDDYEFHMLRDCSHWAPWDRPEEVNRVMSDWLARHPLPAAKEGEQARQQ